MQRALPVRKKLLFSFVTLLAAYCVAEALCTAILPRPAGSIGSDTFAIQEDTGGFCLDLNQGYRITRTPARMARVTHGITEFVGCVKGNAQGFQGDKDFSPAKTASVERRSLVFGDSFTSEAFNKTQWTQRLEDALPRQQFLNLGLDAAGLANWWSTFTRVILPQKYEFDQVVFALIENDLERPFVIGDYQCRHGYSTFGYFGWNPAEFPRTEMRAAYINFTTFQVVKSTEFDESLRTGRLCSGENPHAQWQPWIASGVAHLCGKWFSPPPDVVPTSAYYPPPTLMERPAIGSFSGYQLAMILDFRDRLAAMHKPIIVINIPHCHQLLSGRDGSKRVHEFSDLLGARFIDGTRAFDGLSKAEMRLCYFPFDGHWNQRGSDRFAAYLVDKLRTK